MTNKIKEAYLRGFNDARNNTVIQKELSEVERVARALHNANFHPSDHGSKQVEDFWCYDRDKYIFKAKAAIAAMKEGK